MREDLIRVVLRWGLNFTKRNCYRMAYELVSFLFNLVPPINGFMIYHPWLAMWWKKFLLLVLVCFNEFFLSSNENILFMARCLCL